MATLTKRTSKNQVTLPAQLIKDWADVGYFSVQRVADHLELKPVRVETQEDPLKKFQRIFQEKGFDDGTIAKAIREVRQARR